LQAFGKHDRLIADSSIATKRIGAGEEDRTLDIHLGNPAGTGFLVLTHNYSKPKNVVKAES
jgi:hypothetical protein